MSNFVFSFLLRKVTSSCDEQHVNDNFAVVFVLYEKELGKTWEDIQNEIEEEEDVDSKTDKGDEE
mgnify:FL=1